MAGQIPLTGLEFEMCYKSCWGKKNLKLSPKAVILGSFFLSEQAKICHRSRHAGDTKGGRGSKTSTDDKRHYSNKSNSVKKTILKVSQVN